MKDLIGLGNEGRFEKLGISIFDIPKSLICGKENPSKLSNPVKGDCKASLGFSSDEELEPSEEEDGEDDDEDEIAGDAGDENGEEIGDSGVVSS